MCVDPVDRDSLPCWLIKDSCCNLQVPTNVFCSYVGAITVDKISRKVVPVLGIVYPRVYHPSCKGAIGATQRVAIVMLINTNTFPAIL
jgi:hypothetical protein